MPDLQRYLDIRSAGSGRLTADGSRLVFVTNITGVPQAWSMPAGGGWPVQLTFADHRVGGVAPSPTDPSLVVFTRDSGGNERMQIHGVDPSGFGEHDLVVDPDVIHRFGEFGRDGSWFVFCDNRRNGVDFDLYLRTLGGDESLVAELEGWNVVADVAPDGSSALVGHFASNVDGSVLLVDLASGGVRDLTPHDAPTLNAPAGFTDEGDVLFVSDRDGEFRRAYRHRDGEVEAFGPDADVDGLVVDRGVAAIAWNDGGRTRVAWFNPITLLVEDEIELPMGVAGGFEVAPEGDRMLFTLSGAASPADVWEIDAGGAEPRRVTRSSTAGIDPGSFVEPTLVTVESFDGLEVPVWSYRPEGVERPPVVVSVHGGPEAQERVGFNPIYQYLVASGYAVLAPNVRGSSGYGKTYMSLDDVHKRMDSVEDLNAVGRWVRDAPDLDGDRMAVMGGSYGGFMVLAALTSAPELWAAGVDIVGIANFVTFLENTGDYRRSLREAEYGSLEHDREFLESVSPINHVEEIVAPLLVIHGANDPRVPLGEARQIHDRLRDLGRPVELLVFDDEGHGIVKLANRRIAYGRVVDFLGEHLAG
ncbi:MAG: S9 family peptidase [Acidimicrobiia bacterium]|nr:S9 family peptidase [Acidimicrobiia bacterium]